MKDKLCLTNLTTFYNIEVHKGKSCPCGWTNPDTNTCWSQWAAKQLHREGSGGHVLNKKLSTHQQLTCTAKTAIDILSCTTKNSRSSWRNEILSLCSTLVELRYIWSAGSRSELPKHKTDMDIPEYLQQRTVKKKGLENLSHDDTLRELEVLSLEKALEGSYWFLKVFGGEKRSVWTKALHNDKMRQWAQTGWCEIPSEYSRRSCYSVLGFGLFFFFFHYGSNQSLVQFAQRSSGISAFGDN